MPDTPTPAPEAVPAAPVRPNSHPGAPNPLDYMLIVGAMLMVGGGLIGLFMGDQKQTLPIIASLLSFLCGSVLGGYAGYRWGASDAMKHLAQPGVAQ